MNVYDELNGLVKALKESHEFQVLKETRVKLKGEPKTDELVKDFLKQKAEMEIAQYSGKQPDKEAMDKLEGLYKVLQLNPLAMEYLQAFIRFQMLMGDISKGIDGVVKEAVGE